MIDNFKTFSGTCPSLYHSFLLFLLFVTALVPRGCSTNVNGHDLFNQQFVKWVIMVCKRQGRHYFLSMLMKDLIYEDNIYKQWMAKLNSLALAKQIVSRSKRKSDTYCFGDAHWRFPHYLLHWFLPVSAIWAINNSISNAKWYLPALGSNGHLIPAAFGLWSLFAVHTFVSNRILIHAHLNSTSLKMEKELHKNTTKACFLNY